MIRRMMLDVVVDLVFERFGTPNIEISDEPLDIYYLTNRC